MADARELHRLLVFAADELGVGHHAVVDRREGIARAQAQRAVGGLVGLGPAAAIGQGEAVIALGQREVRIEPQRRFELGQRIVEAPREQVSAARARDAPRDPRCRPGSPPAPRARRSAPRPSCPPSPCGRRTCGWWPAGRAPGRSPDRWRWPARAASCAIEVVLPRHPPVVRQRPHHQVPGVELLGRLAQGAEILRGIDLRLDRRDDRLGDLVLHREHVGNVAIVAFRPDVAAGDARR